MSQELDRAATLAALRTRVARLERGRVPDPASAGISITASVDGFLPGGSGLPRCAIHEVAAEDADTGAAYGLLTLLAARAGGTTLWIAPEPEVWPPGAARLGLDPSALVLVRAPKQADALWAVEEALRCPAVGCTILVAPKGIDLTASRRLQLAAEAGGGVGLALIEPPALASPSAARTRWRISAAPGPSRVEHHLGDPMWALELLKAQGGRPGRWLLSLDADARELHPADGIPIPQRWRAVG